MEDLIRLQKFLADCGVASRRKSEELILQGKVSVNGKVNTQLGTKINPSNDEIIFNGKKLELKKEYVYILLNKPIGYVTTSKEQFNRDSVLDLVKTNKRLVTVGRLDMYTSGALILTNDGEFVYKVTHPKHEIEKTYTVTIKGIIKNSDVKQLSDGVEIEDKEKTYKTKPAKIKILKTDFEKDISRLEITIHEGKNRQVRKMCESIGYKVIALHRSKIGDIGVKNIEIGKWRYLTEKEKNYILKRKIIPNFNNNTIEKINI